MSHYSTNNTFYVQIISNISVSASLALPVGRFQTQRRQATKTSGSSTRKQRQSCRSVSDEAASDAAVMNAPGGRAVTPVRPIEATLARLLDSMTESRLEIRAAERKKLEVDEANAEARLLKAQAMKAEAVKQREAVESAHRLARTAVEGANDSPDTGKMKLRIREMELKIRLEEVEIRKSELQARLSSRGGKD